MARKSVYYLNHRKRFESELSTTIPQFRSFNATLISVLRGGEYIPQLKTKAKTVEAHAEKLLQSSEKIRYYSFQKMLMETLESRDPLMKYINSMPINAKNVHIKQLRILWQSCDRTNITIIDEICHSTQTQIDRDFSNNSRQKDNKFLTQDELYRMEFALPRSNELLNLHADIFGDDDFHDQRIITEPHLDKQIKRDEEHCKMINKLYVMDSNGEYVPKSSMKDSHERQDPADIPRPGD